MSPTQFHDHHHQAKRETNGLYPPPLKINKDSHFIKKSPPSSSSSSSSSLVSGMASISARPPQRQPVIIYTHSPKVIHTNPRDFMQLVQKLTGLSRSDHDDTVQPKLEPGNDSSEEYHKNIKNVMNDDNDCTSVVTDENGSSVGDVHVNSCFIPSIFEPPNPCFNNFPFFTQNPTDFSCSTKPFYNYTDPLFLMPNMRSSISSSTLESMKEFPEY
ncbi:unnamed protein product [Ilex paraguariensis]|uniref:VQ domain-containing protein n=1 Tax=Ilex paraguariensis TaxID=185542 RepID=A0ABC8TKG3_9AQUA